MKKSKNSLKKVYESVFKNHKVDIVKEFRDSRVRNVSSNILNSKNLKDLFNKYNISTNIDDVINQKIPTKIPGLGTFDLSSIQIGLISCANNFFFGKKETVRHHLKLLFENKIYQESLNYKMDSESVSIFIKSLIENNFLNNDLSIINFPNIDLTTSVGNPTGHVWEVFLGLNLNDNNIKVSNLKDLIISLNESGKWSACVLVIVYSKLLQNNIIFDESIVLNIFNNYEDNVRKLYKKFIFNRKIKTNMFKDLFPEGFDVNNLEVTFALNHDPIDMIIKNNDVVVAFLDLKATTTSARYASGGGYYVSPDLSRATIENIKKQIDICRNKNIVSDNVNLGILNANYEFNNEGITIRQIKCPFNTLSTLLVYNENTSSSVFKIPPEVSILSNNNYDHEEQIFCTHLLSANIEVKDAEKIKTISQNRLKKLFCEIIFEESNAKNRNNAVTKKLNLIFDQKNYREFSFIVSDLRHILSMLAIIKQSNLYKKADVDFQNSIDTIFIKNIYIKLNNYESRKNVNGKYFANENSIDSFCWSVFKQTFPNKSSNIFSRQITRYLSLNNITEFKSQLSSLNKLKDQMKSISKICATNNIINNKFTDRVKNFIVLIDKRINEIANKANLLSAEVEEIEEVLSDKVINSFKNQSDYNSLNSNEKRYLDSIAKQLNNPSLSKRSVGLRKKVWGKIASDNAEKVRIKNSIEELNRFKKIFNNAVSSLDLSDTQTDITAEVLDAFDNGIERLS